MTSPVSVLLVEDNDADARYVEELLSEPSSARGERFPGLPDASDEVEIDTTLRHHIQLGFRSLVALMPEAFALAPDLVDTVHRIAYDPFAEDALPTAVNRLNDAAQYLRWRVGYSCPQRSEEAHV